MDSGVYRQCFLQEGGNDSEATGVILDKAQVAVDMAYSHMPYKTDAPCLMLANRNFHRVKYSLPLFLPLLTPH